jgi:uncharacterized protein YdcH (DUF465 family)
MSNLATASDESLKNFLMSNDEQYRELATEHHRYDERLSELSSLPHPTDDEMLEETVLKKKKLFLKDQMESIAAKYKSSTTSH